MFNVGDRVRCKRGFLRVGTLPTASNFQYGGAGYVEGRVFTIKRIVRSPERNVVFFSDNEYGVFMDALEPADVVDRYITPFKFV